MTIRQAMNCFALGALLVAAGPLADRQAILAAEPTAAGAPAEVWQRAQPLRSATDCESAVPTLLCGAGNANARRQRRLTRLESPGIKRALLSCLVRDRVKLQLAATSNANSVTNHAPPAGPAADTRPQNQRQAVTAFFRGDNSQPATVPPVRLTEREQELCRVQVGGTMPEIRLDQLAGGQADLAALRGKGATVVVFWSSDRHAARQELADLGPDVLQPFRERGVAVVGIIVQETPENARTALQEAGAEFPNLLDSEGTAFAQVGSERLPRTYVLDAQGKILWFDIEYSLATRRELRQTLLAVLGEPAPAAGAANPPAPAANPAQPSESAR